MRLAMAQASSRSRDLDQRAAALERGGDHVAGAAWSAAACSMLGGHAIDEGGIRTEQDRLRQFVVLGLGEQVDRHPVGIGRAVGDDQHLRRAGHHVDADDAEDAALGAGDVGVAGTDDLVHLRNGLRAVGQRRDGLRAADGEHAIDAGQMGSGQHQLRSSRRRRRHHHDQFPDAGHLGRNRVHQHRTRDRPPCRRARRGRRDRAA